jgi:hypothetical protein
MPSFMTLANSLLTINPNDNAQSKTYTMKTTMSTPNNGDQTWLTVTVIVANCVITDLVAPQAPVNKSYTIKSCDGSDQPRIRAESSMRLHFRRDTNLDDSIRRASDLRFNKVHPNGGVKQKSGR